MRWRCRTLFWMPRLALTCLLVTLLLLCYLGLWKTVKPNVYGILCATSEKETWKLCAYQAAGEKAKIIPKVDVHDLGHTDQHESASLNGLRYHRGGASDARRYASKNPSPAESDTSLARPELEGDRTSPTRSRHGPDNTPSSRAIHIQGNTSSTNHGQDSVTQTRPKLDQDKAPQTIPGHAQNSTSLKASQVETLAMNSSTRQNKSTNIETQEGYTQSNSSLYEKWTREQELKKKHLQETCNSLRNDSRAAHLKYELTEAVLHTLNHLLVVDSRKIIYCYVPKVGCTSWKRIFLVLLDTFKRVEDVSHSKAHYTPIPSLTKFTLDEAKQRLTNYSTFIITRDPFKRVVSCFRDKFEKDNADNRALQRGVMKAIQGKSGNYSNSDKILPKVGFPQFARYVADPRNTFSHYGPTEHWNEVYKMCHPCLVRYDFIGEFDTLIRDSELILKATGLNNTVKFPGATNPTNSSGDAVKNNYLSLLNKTEITALNKRYEIDSELFGYSEQPVPG